MAFRNPHLALPQGSYTGTIEGGVAAFRGIPYATFGRFEPPRICNATNPDRRGHRNDTPAPIDAIRRGAICPQLPSRLVKVTGPLPPSTGPQSETECGVLSIWTPAMIDVKEASYPIMVYIHGGAFITGGSQIPWYEGGLLAREGVVVISINYRLGIFGFLFDDEQIRDGKGFDIGMQDVFTAFEWIAANASSFGGDASRICSFGQSAGGYMQSIILDHRPELFNRAIIQSTPALLLRTPEQAAEVRKIAEANLPDGKTFQTATTAELLQTQQKTNIAMAAGGAMNLAFPPCTAGIDGKPPGARNPSVRDRDILIGWTADDALAFHDMDLDRRGVPADDRAAHYAESEKLTEQNWGNPAMDLARRFAQLGNRVTAYKYVWRPKGAKFGAAHCGELPLLLGDEEAWKQAPMLGEVPYSEWYERGKAVRRAWADFAKEGTPPRQLNEFEMYAVSA